MVFEEGLDISSLPEALKEDFKKLDQLEGQYRLTSVLMEAADLLELSPRKGPQCSFCGVKKQAERMNELVEKFRLMKTLSKVSLSCDLFLSIVLEGEGGVGDVQEGDQVDQVLEAC